MPVNKFLKTLAYYEMRQARSTYTWEVPTGSVLKQTRNRTHVDLFTEDRSLTGQGN